MPAGDIYSVRIDWATLYRNYANVLHVKQIDADGADIPTVSLADSILNTILPLMLPKMSQYTNADNLHIRKILPTPHQGIDIPLPYSPGADAGELLPMATTLLIRCYSAVATRKGRGRIKLGGMAVGSNLAGDWKASTIASIDSMLAVYFAPFLGGVSNIHFEGVVYSPTDNVARDIHGYKTMPNTYRTKSRAGIP